MVLVVGLGGGGGCFVVGGEGDKFIDSFARDDEEMKSILFVHLRSVDLV